jgi:endoglucanase
MPRKAFQHLAALLLLAAAIPALSQSPTKWPLWDQYAQRFIDAQGRVIDHTGADRTTSEAQSYSMFFALVAGDQARFDKLLSWTENNLAQGDLTLHLPAWNWGLAPDKQWKVLDPNSAADADLWLAYDLLEAGRLWNSPRYLNLGRVIMSRIAKDEVTNIPCVGQSGGKSGGPMVIPAPVGFHPAPDKWIVNPSYVPLPVLQRFATEQPGGPWYNIMAELPQFLGQTSVGEFSMDWVQCTTGKGWLAVPLPGPAPKEAHPPDNGQTKGQESAPPAAYGSYDAIRVYLWAGISDPGMSYGKDLPKAVVGMAKYLSTNITPPLQIDSSGKIISPDGPAGFSAAVIPYLYSLGMKDAAKAQMQRLEATKDPATGLYGRTVAYYDQNLALFCMAWTEQRFRFDKQGHLKLSTPKQK